MQMIDVLKRLAELDAKNPNRPEYKDKQGATKSLKESVDPLILKQLVDKYESGEIDFDEFKDQLDSIEYTDYSMRQGEMGNPDWQDQRAWDREKGDWDQMDRDEREDDVDLDSLEESAQLGECGAMSSPSTPANINMSAASAQELGDLLKAIVTLAGTGDQKPVEPLSTPPVIATTGASDTTMKSMIDRLNSIDREDELSEYDNTPADPTDTNEFDAEQYAHHENPPGAAVGRANTANPRGVARSSPTMEQIEKSLFDEYQKFIKEGYTVTRGIDTDRYQERPGLEGPFSTKSGKVVYYDPKEGKYYDPDSDFYIDHDDWQAMNEDSVSESGSMRLIAKDDNGPKAYKLYKDTEWGEYVVKFYVNGIHQDEADYHTDDKNDAIDTARSMIEEAAPKGWEGTVKAMKKHKDQIDNPWALSHWMKNKGYKSHKP